MYNLFCGLKNAQKQSCVCVLQKRPSSKFYKTYKKARVPELIFNKVKHVNLLEKDLGTCVCQWIYGQHPLNADDWKNSHDCWSKMSFFNPLRFLILNDRILMDLLMGWKTFILKFFTKERRNSLELSEIFVVLSMICYSCLINFWNFQETWPRRHLLYRCQI